MTHGVHWLPMVDTIVVMVDGKISEYGSYDDLLSHDGAFAQFLKVYLTQEDADEDDDDPEGKEVGQYGWVGGSDYVEGGRGPGQAFKF